MKKENSSQYVEVEPILPTYYFERFLCISRVVKKLFSVNPNKPNKIISQDDSGLFMMEESKNINQIFSTHPLHHDTVSDENAANLLYVFNDDKEFTEQELAKWGITKVYLFQNDSKVLSVHDFFDRLPAPSNTDDSIGFNYLYKVDSSEDAEIFK